MQEGPRNTPVGTAGHPATETEHVFLLRRLNHAGVKFAISMDFSPAKLDCVNQPPTHGHSPVPIFNRDGRYYTPAFILPEDQNRFQQNEQICLLSHLKKVKEMEEEKQQIFLPKPSSANQFCMVCKDSFDDYLTHINTPSHTQTLLASPFYHDVKAMCAKYGHKNCPSSTKKIRKQRSAKSEKKVGKKTKREVKDRKKSTESSSTGIESSQQFQENQLILEK